MTEFPKVLLLALLQGVAEFLPVSSSAHLAVGKALLGLRSPGLTLELALHVGTLLSVLVFFRRTVRWALSGTLRGDREAWRYALAILLSMLPCGIAAAVLGDRLERAFGHAAWIGCGWLVTAALLLTMRHGGRPAKPVVDDAAHRGRVPPATAFAMGLGQAVAMFPGISRSGTTIWVAWRMGLPAAEAARFSFLMSVPVVGGALLLAVAKTLRAGGADAALAAGAPPATWMLAAGAATAAVVGYASLSLLVRMLERGRFWVFGVYCALAGVAMLLASAR